MCLPSFILLNSNIKALESAKKRLRRNQILESELNKNYDFRD